MVPRNMGLRSVPNSARATSRRPTVGRRRRTEVSDAVGALRFLALPLLLTAVAIGAVPGGPTRIEKVCPIASDSPPNRVLLIIQTGGASAPVRQVCVRFAEDEISGTEALIRADVDVVFKSYGAMGRFVCSILGVGPTVDGCPSSGQSWTYSRAPYPAESFSLSNSGASSVRLRDGDVEGWRFANAPPPYSSVSSVCGGPEPQRRTTSTTTTATIVDGQSPASPAAADPAPPVTGSEPSTDPSSPPSPTPDRQPSSTEGRSPTPPQDPNQASPSVGTGDDASAERAPTADPGAPVQLQRRREATAAERRADVERPPPAAGREGGSPSLGGYVAFAILLAGLGTWGMRLHRRR